MLSLCLDLERVLEIGNDTQQNEDNTVSMTEMDIIRRKLERMNERMEEMRYLGTNQQWSSQAFPVNTYQGNGNDMNGKMKVMRCMENNQQDMRDFQAFPVNTYQTQWRNNGDTAGNRGYY